MYKSLVLEYSEAALQEAAAGYRRIEDFLHRVGPVEIGEWTPEFEAAMNDDISVPRALAEIHTAVRAGNTALASGSLVDAQRIAAAVRAMTALLGVDPQAPQWAEEHQTRERAMAALDVLVDAELERRTTARSEKDWATADAVRDRLIAAGIDVTDTPDGPQWSLKN